MSKQLPDHERDRIIYSAGVRQKHHDEVEEVLRGTLYPESLSKHLLELESRYILTKAQRRAIQEAVFGKEE